MNENMKSLFSNLGKDLDLKPCKDYVNFYMPNPPPIGQGGAQPARQALATPVHLNMGIPVHTPALVLPTTSTVGAQATPGL